ncbi:MAG: SDR family NAD(P)-dependent oxidoreductase [Dehalococcoidia bacterium]
MRELTGRTAIVTGASRGIGPYICQVLANEGLNVVLAARSVSELDQVAASLQTRGSHTLVVSTDVADAHNRRTLVERANARFGKVDILVNNAGIEANGLFARASPAGIEQVLAVNLTAAMLLTREVLPGMLERRLGHIVSIASLAGKAPTPYGAAYAASKSGIIGFSRSLHAELRGTGVGVSAVSPGFVSEAGMFHNATERLPIKPSRLVGTSTPQQVAEAVLRAIQGNKVDVIVNHRRPMRPIFALEALAPGAVIRMLAFFGVTRMMRTMADSHESPAGEGEGTGGQPGTPK